MPSIRLIFLWHMHQPFYKDLVSGEYRLPWVRMHALKDYYGMVKLLDEFPGIHQTFNLVPSLVTQIEDYVAGSARDPFLDIAAKPASDLTLSERRFALKYLFQANATHLIGRYPRFAELEHIFSAYHHDPVRAEPHFNLQDYTDLQVLSQLVWFDEFYLDNPTPELAQVLNKGRNYSLDDQCYIIAAQREIMSAVLPAYHSAAKRGSIEISTSPFYHPILPLLCDTDQGRVSSPGLPLPQAPFRHPEDAEEQLKRGFELHERVFGTRPQGVWPSEGSVSEEVLGLAHRLGVNWMATDEGVLARSLGAGLERNRDGVLLPHAAELLYNLYRFELGGTRMHMVFRDHSLSDLIGFVYSGMGAEEAAEHFLYRIKASAEPLLEKGKDVVVPIILDGENAWEYFPKSGRKFLRLLYQAIQDYPIFECLTVSEAIARHKPKDFGKLDRLVPGSWINSNFNVWIGASEDNTAWDYLSAARDKFTELAPKVPEQRRKLAFDELLIAEGSDWNWWYGPDHSSANDRDFDELYRKHLSNVYQALEVSPPDYLAQPIKRAPFQAQFVDQTAYIHPRIDSAYLGYFDWIGAAHYSAGQRNAAMHGSRILLDSAYVGLDQGHLFCRLDFKPEALARNLSGDEELAVDCEITMSVERLGPDQQPRDAKFRLDVEVKAGQIAASNLQSLREGPNDGTVAARNAHTQPDPALLLRLGRVFEVQLSMDFLGASFGDWLMVRFSLWQDKVPMDALPHEGAIRIRVMTESELVAQFSGEHWSA